VPSAIDSPIWGMTTSVAKGILLDNGITDERGNGITE